MSHGEHARIVWRRSGRRGTEEEGAGFHRSVSDREADRRVFRRGSRQHFRQAAQVATPAQMQAAFKQAVAGLPENDRAQFNQMLQERKAGKGMVDIERTGERKATTGRGSSGGADSIGLDDLLGGLLGGAAGGGAASGGGGLGDILGGLLGSSSGGSSSSRRRFGRHSRRYGGGGTARRSRVIPGRAGRHAWRYPESPIGKLCWRGRPPMP